ncbi:hypothetical protein E1B28_013709 [Marasmius oreades]|uniref:Uncharacterized protein n=1 Tax=Marasmius oreades TaxID=181124 RepID=A0A9P7UN23_9AGAR|nr:uncharacterized protein E1B28_013709 [Marasmius oreades]KAG7087768.1 hypothetical protein E1B28_013709 [Marasmius oreades]
MGNQSHGRAVDPLPVLSVLLEPRSVVITTGEFYLSYLHGINEVSEDVIIQGEGEGNQAPRIKVSETSVGIDNWKLVDGCTYKDVLQSGGSLQRETRYSLTCRDVVRVFRATGAFH